MPSQSSFMEDQNRTFTLSLSSIENPSSTNLVLERTNSNNNSTNTNTAPGAIEAPGADIASDTVVEGAKSEVAGSEITVKRGRGRPRKYDGNGNLLSPVPMTTPQGFPTHPLVRRSEKRSRGRPRGSGKLQILASIGGSVAETAGGCFTPHVVIVNTGEDVVNKVLSFFQRGPRAACILSATGAVSSVIIRQPDADAGILRYEGRYEIVSLSGSSSYSGGAHGQNDMLSVSLAKPDGKVFGGVIESSMIAAIPIQVVMGTFKQNIGKQIKRRHSSSPTAPNVPADPDSVGPNIKVPKLMESEQSGTTPTLTTNGVPDNVIPATTNVVLDNVITEDLNMHSASVNGVGLDNQTLQKPIVMAQIYSNISKY